MAMDRRRILPRALTLPVLLTLGAFAAGCNDGGTDGGDAGAADTDGDPLTADEIRGGRAASAAPSSPRSSPEAASSSEESSARPEGASTAGAGPDAATSTSGTSDSGTAHPSGPPYAVQLGAFQREANAQRLREALEATDFPVWTGETASDDLTLLRVRVGATSTVADARRLLEAIHSRLPDAPDSVWIAPLGTEGGAPEELMSATRAVLEND